MPMMINPALAAVSEPPIAEAVSWIDSIPRPDNRPLLDLGQAVPSYPPAQELRDAVAAAAKEGDTAFYTPILGLPVLREALAHDLSDDYKAAISSEEVAVTAGANHAYCLATMAVAGAGDAILLGQPSYFNHAMWFDMQGIETIDLPCRVEEEGMVPDPEAAAALITPRTRAICLVTPNNPSGTIYSPERLKAFYDLARQHNLALILDETYKDFRPGGDVPHNLFQEPDWQDTLVQLYSFSKVYSLTGYRVGSIAAGPQLLSQIAKIADCMTICAPHLGQRAALFGLQQLKAWREQKRDEALARIDALDEAFALHKPAFELVSRGAFFAYLRHPFEDKSAETVAKLLLAEESLFCLPGSYFGPGQERFLRLAFANASPDQMDEIALRLARLKLA